MSFVLNVCPINEIQSKFVYPSDKSFDKRVLIHVAKHFKQYKHSLKRDHFKPKEKTKEEMYDVVPNGHSHDGWIRLVDYWCSNQHEVLFSDKLWLKWTYLHSICFKFSMD